MKLLMNLFVVLTAIGLFACGTTDGSLRDKGKSDSYIQGFHDGRHSGMSEEGNYFEHYIRDNARFVDDPDYQQGWIAGESEGKRLQDQPAAVGTAIGGAYSGSQINKEVNKNQDFDKTARDAVKGVDTSGMENLGK